MTPKKLTGFDLPRRVQREYEHGMRQILGRILIPKQPEQTFEQWQAMLAERSSQMDIQDASKLLARRMCKWVHVDNCKTWREAARKSTQSSKLYAALQNELQGTATGARVSQIVRENAAYISSIALESAVRLTDEVAKAQQAGARPETVVKMMRSRFPALLRSRVKLIARTETAKASSALTRARAENIGADWYLWITSEDVRTRTSHKKMNDVLVSWSNPPSPEALVGETSKLGTYNAGECPNCRCVPAPLLTLDDVAWPHRVYHDGSIKQMTRAAFKALSHVEDRELIAA